MKKILSIIFLSVLFYSCKKQLPSQTLVLSPYDDRVISFLKNALEESDFAKLDFSNRAISKEQPHWLLRYGLKGKTLSSDFILLSTDRVGNCSMGRFIHLDQDKNNLDSSNFSGNIQIETLGRELVLSSVITNGYILAMHPRMSEVNVPRVSADSMMAADIIPSYYYDYSFDELPEVLVVGSFPNGGGGSSSQANYYQLISFLGQNGTVPPGLGISYGVYSPAGGGPGFSGTGSGNITISFDNSVNQPGIDLPAYLNCFASIPDEGANCTVTIFTDLPVNDNPTLFFNWYSGATGHCFLQLTKTNGSQSIRQVIGFTPAKPLQVTSAGSSVPSKMVDNAGHKYNASLVMQISPAQLSQEIRQIQSLAGSMQYRIAYYNCVDFGLQVINTIRGVNPLIIPKYQIPGQPPGISNTPEGLYQLLTSMKESSSPDAKNIITDAMLYAGASHGPCN
jgi:hypothetical protein